MIPNIFEEDEKKVVEAYKKYGIPSQESKQKKFGRNTAMLKCMQHG